MDKKTVLAKYLGVDASELDKSGLDGSMFNLGRQEYMVLTESQANKRVKESIKETLFAFNTSFLEAHVDGLDAKSLDKIKELYEDANPVLLRLIKDFNHFVNDAVLSDGRGHFLSGYDGQEIEQDQFLIYRTN